MISGYLSAAEGRSIPRSLVALLATAQTGPATLNQTRQAFSGCLGTLVRVSLRQRISAADFAVRCTAEEQAFRSAAIALDVAAGIRRADAEQTASFGITDMRDNALQRYKDYIETNTEPR